MNTAKRLVESFVRREPEVVFLAEALSLAARIDRLLLRETRLDLCLSVEHEAVLWFSPLVAHRSVSAFSFDSGVVEILRQRLVNKGGLDAAWQRTKRLHAHLPHALRLEEEITWRGLAKQPLGDIDRTLRPAVRALHDPTRKGLELWGRRMLRQIPQQVTLTGAAQELRNELVLIEAGGKRGESEWTQRVELTGEHISCNVRIVGERLEISTRLSSTSHDQFDVGEARPNLVEVRWQTQHGEHSQLVHWGVQQTIVKGVKLPVTLRFADGRAKLLKDAMMEKMAWFDALRKYKVDPDELRELLAKSGYLSAVDSKMPTEEMPPLAWLKVRDALIRFQAAAGLVEDGVPKPEMMDALRALRPPSEEYAWDAIVISSRADRAWAQKLVEDLRGYGLRISFADEALGHRNILHMTMMTMMTMRARGAIVIVSDSALNSKWVRAVYTRFLKSGNKLLIPLLYNLSDPHRLPSVLKLRNGPDFRNVRGERYADLVHRLAENLKGDQWVPFASDSEHRPTTGGREFDEPLKNGNPSSDEIKTRCLDWVVRERATLEKRIDKGLVNEEFMVEDAVDSVEDVEVVSISLSENSTDVDYDEDSEEQFAYVSVSGSAILRGYISQDSYEYAMYDREDGPYNVIKEVEQITFSVQWSARISILVDHGLTTEHGVSSFEVRPTLLDRDEINVEESWSDFDDDPSNQYRSPSQSGANDNPEQVKAKSRNPKKTAMRDEAELLEAWRNGNREAGDTLVRKHFSTLHRFLTNKVPEHVVPDLIQETMLTCVGSVANLREGGSFKSYLLGIARRNVYRYYRRFGRKEGKLDLSSDVAVDLIDETQVSSILVQRAEQKLILMALRRIPLKEQIALELVYWEELNRSECAEIMDLSTSKFRDLVKQAKASFATAIEKGPGTSTEKRTISQQMDLWIAGIHREVNYTRST